MRRPGLRPVALMTAGVALLLAGCSSDPPALSSGAPSTSGASSDGSRATSSPPSEAGSPSDPTSTQASTQTPTTEPPEPYEPNPAKVDADAKRTAARAVEKLPKVAQVTYTQYFGYLPPLASILVEADFTDGEGTTYDVQISQTDGRWGVDSINPAEPVPAADDPSPLIRRVLNSKRIDLPWAGRVDVASGRVADSVLRSMLAVSKEHRIGISVLISAHPVNVFGTDRRSNHPDGRAYDIGSVDGRLVVDPDNADVVRDLMQVAATTGAYQVGGPEDLDGGGSQYFSDATHSDHVHVGFDS